MNTATKTWFAHISTKLLLVVCGLILCGAGTAAVAAINSALLDATPPEFRYPYHTSPNQIRDEIIILTNTGDIMAEWSVGTESGFITFVGSTSGICGVGPSNTAEFAVRIIGPITEGFYAGTIEVTYFDAKKSPQTVLSVPVDLYNFTNFYLPKDVAIRTELVSMNVNQASEIANNTPGKMFSFFADASDYIRDGYLILGNSAANLSYSTFGGGGSTGAPSPSNPYGYLFAATDSCISDSTTFGGYRFATGKGYNRDSTLEFICDYFAPTHIDSGNFVILRYYIYKGPNNPTGSVANLTVAYHVDADVPSDISLENLGGFDTTLSPNAVTRNMMYLQGTPINSPNNNQNRFIAVGGRVHHGYPPIGGFVVPNPTYIYPQSGWENDSLWNRMQHLTLPVSVQGGDYEIDPPHAAPTGVPEDLSMALVFLRNQTVRGDPAGTGPDTLKIAVVVAGTNSTGSLPILKGVMDRAYKFIRTNKLIYCRCGDPDSNNSINISDGVRILGYIFTGAASPNPRCRADANGDGMVNISDIVFLMNYIFNHGPVPSGC